MAISFNEAKRKLLSGNVLVWGKFGSIELGLYASGIRGNAGYSHFFLGKTRLELRKATKIYSKASLRRGIRKT